MADTDVPHCTAFLALRRIAAGPYAQVARELAHADLASGSVLVFDDASGAQVDLPLASDLVAEPVSAPQVGRPRLGVVAREVTLLPRHWDWLALQPGGASAALRRLVDEARQRHAARDTQRLAQERTYRCMSALAGGLPGFEEAARALFAPNAEAFAQHSAAWPDDVQSYLRWLARDAFGPGADTAPAA